MSGTKTGWSSMRTVFVRHGTNILLGLAAVLVPAVLVGKSLEHAHGAVSQALKKVAPTVKTLGGIDIGPIIFVGIIAGFWVLGWLLSRTELGQRVLAWEKTKFHGKSPFLQKRAKKTGKGASPAEKDPQPALAHVAGSWLPGVIVEEQAGGWASVFVPDVPSVAAGRLYCVHEDQVLRLDVPMDAYRETLVASGKGSQDWLVALSEAKPGV